MGCLVARPVIPEFAREFGQSVYAPAYRLPEAVVAALAHPPERRGPLNAWVPKVIPEGTPTAGALAMAADMVRWLESRSEVRALLPVLRVRTLTVAERRTAVDVPATRLPLLHFLRGAPADAWGEPWARPSPKGRTAGGLPGVPRSLGDISTILPPRALPNLDSGDDPRQVMARLAALCEASVMTVRAWVADFLTPSPGSGACPHTSVPDMPRPAVRAHMYAWLERQCGLPQRWCPRILGLRFAARFHLPAQSLVLEHLDLPFEDRTFGERHQTWRAVAWLWRYARCRPTAPDAFAPGHTDGLAEFVRTGRWPLTQS